MGWPLILALAGTAAQGTAESAEENIMDQYAREQARKEQEARNRLLENQAKTEQQEAMARFLATSPQPAAVGKESVQVDYPDAPNMSGVETLAGLGALAQMLGQYYDTRVGKDYGYSGSGTSLTTPTRAKTLDSAMEGGYG